MEDEEDEAPWESTQQLPDVYDTELPDELNIFDEDGEAEAEELEEKPPTLDESIITALREIYTEEEIEDLLYKNTWSFRCLAQVVLSNSSLMRHILYHFPALEDPGIDEAFDYMEPEAVYDNIGGEKYKALCKEANIVPISRVLNSLATDTMNLKFFGLSYKQIKALCITLMLNVHVRELILEENWICYDGAYWLGEMLRENNSVEKLNLRECRLNADGMKLIMEGLSLNQALTELDLSNNSLGDEGLEYLIAALKENQQITKLNLRNNNLGDKSGAILGKFLEENNTITHLDLSWNDLYTVEALKPLCNGLVANHTVVDLKLSWNGIGSPEAIAPVARLISKTETLENLDLSSNRICDSMVDRVNNALQKNQTLKSVNIGNNYLRPSQALEMLNVFKNNEALQSLNMENTFVNKNFVGPCNKLIKKGYDIKYEGVLNNYNIAGPNPIQLIWARCRYLSQKPKRAKKKVNFAAFIHYLPNTPVDKKEFDKLLKKGKAKLDPNLKSIITQKFTKDSKIDTPAMKESFKKYFPDDEIPPPKEKKKKKGKKRRRSKGSQASDANTTVTEIAPQEITDVAINEGNKNVAREPSKKSIASRQVLGSQTAVEKLRESRESLRQKRSQATVKSLAAARSREFRRSRETFDARKSRESVATKPSREVVIVTSKNKMEKDASNASLGSKINRPSSRLKSMETTGRPSARSSAMLKRKSVVIIEEA